MPDDLGGVERRVMRRLGIDDDSEDHKVGMYPIGLAWGLVGGSLMWIVAIAAGYLVWRLLGW